MATKQTKPDQAPPGTEMPDELHPRHIAVRLVEIAAVIALVAIAVSALPGLDQVRDRLTDAGAVWLVLLAAAEVASCLGYLLVFRSTFCPRMPWGLSYDISMAELAANSLLPTGGAGGLALGVWALRQAGMATAHIARRTVAFFLVTSAANFLGVIVAGLGMFTGIVPGQASAVLTLGPAVIAGAVCGLAWTSPRLLRSFGESPRDAERERLAGRIRHRLHGALKATADGVDLAKTLLRSHSFGVVVGSLAYMGFDIAALGFGFAAVGHVPAAGTLVLGYLVGQLGNLVPLPGGIGGTEGGLVGVFALYHVGVADAAAAVLIYRLFQLIIPALLGAPAFVLLRRKLGRGEHQARVCGPLSSELPARGG
ncbi:MAG: flippase-like domain-containing protein [Solirubrobacterales bacterium]|nr:flippase-like domain-containing protein [Solirubrobacterales bacterium]